MISDMEYRARIGAWQFRRNSKTKKNKRKGKRKKTPKQGNQNRKETQTNTESTKGKRQESSRAALITLFLCTFITVAIIQKRIQGPNPTESKALGFKFDLTIFEDVERQPGPETNLKKALHLNQKMTKCKSNTSYLKSMFEKNLITPGLKIKHNPCIAIKTDEFNQKWEKCLEQASLNLMKILSEENEKLSESYKEKLNNLYPHLSTDEKCMIKRKEQSLLQSLQKQKQKKIDKISGDRKTDLDMNINNLFCENNENKAKHTIQTTQKRRILTNQWLTDNDIRDSLRLLKLDNPWLGGCYDPIDGETNFNFDFCSTEAVQIINNGYKHWVTVSNWKGYISIYDSLNMGMTEILKKAIYNLFSNRNELPDFVFEKMQQQKGGNDCGLFSIATAVSISHNEDPSETTYDQSRMRNHLLECLENEKMTKFPTTAEQSQVENETKHDESKNRGKEDKITTEVENEEKGVKTEMANEKNVKTKNENRKRKNKARRFVRRSKTVKDSCVFKIGNVTLSPAEESLLSKGLKFCPQPNSVDMTQTKADLWWFDYRLRWKDFWEDRQDAQNDNEDFGLKSKNQDPKAPPKSADAALEAYIKSINLNVLNTTYKNTEDDNLSTEERQALKSLKTREDIVVKRVDKGSGVCVMERNLYIQEAEKQLQNEKYYKKLNEDPTDKYLKDLKNLLEEGVEKEEITKKTMNNILPKNPKTARFYILPKIHKVITKASQKLVEKMVPGRPVVSGNGCLTENLSKFVDFWLKPIVKNITSYIKDTNHFIRIIDNLKHKKLPEGSFIVTADITSMYNNINQRAGTNACIEYLRKYQQPGMPTAEYLGKLILFVLTYNYLSFNDNVFLQILGTAMGTVMAPSFANIFMAHLEESMLLLAPSQPFLYKRFIDDIFIIWTSGREEFEKFKKHCNEFNNDIKFEWTEMNEEGKTAFLDVELTLSDGFISTRIFSKACDKHQYILPTSAHPKSCWKSLPYSLFLRAKRICSSESLFLADCLKIKSHLVNRQYPMKVIMSALKEVKKQSRESLLNHTKKTSDRTPLILTYHQKYENTPRECHNFDPILYSSKRQEASHKQPPLIGFRRPKNLGDLLVHAKLEKSRDPIGFHVGCESRKCIVCDNNESKSTVDGEKIKTHLNCNSKHVIYKCWCEKHPEFSYYGQTSQKLKQRHYGHRSTVKHGLEKFGEHFHEPGHGVEPTQLLKIAALEQPRNKDQIYRRFRETAYIKKNKSIISGGNTVGDTIRLD